MSYLAELMLRLSAGVFCLDAATRVRHKMFLIHAQNDDGGFSGRKGPSDLYYTGFAMRGLTLLGELDEGVAGRVTGLLKDRLAPRLPGVDFISLITCAVLAETATGRKAFAELGIDARQAVGEFFRPFRRDDGGYAKTPRGGQSSTYHTFLVAACQQLLGAPLEEPKRMVELTRSRQRDDGGFVELDAMRHSGTNPTAAAVGLLKICDALDRPTAAAATGFLARMQTPEGGMRANQRIGVADLLSTFTAVVALHDTNSAEAIATGAALRFAESLQMPRGGFRAGAWDDAADVEYTFYGLGVLGLLAS